MEEPAVQQERTEGVWEGGGQDGGGKADWKSDCSLSSLLKHSCFLCWSSPRDGDAVEEADERVLAKVSEIRELENAVAVESLELQEQQSDRKDLEETLEKLETHKDKLVQQIKTTRQLCYEESQQILSLQSEEVQKESQVEEYEKELARARWRLRRLREEVKQAKRKVEEAGERNTPLQDSIRQSYEEILQEENTLCSLSGSAVTPESQLEESTSPADTTEDDPLPLKPWGRSQSLPAYADLIMRASTSSFCNNLANTREEVDDSGSSSTKMDRSDIEDEPEEKEMKEEEQRLGEAGQSPLNQLDFYQENPFATCQSDHDVFNEDIFPKTDTSDGFASDPFKGSDPFAADVLFPENTVDPEGGAGPACDEADTSLSCAENKASTGTQCFESEFPDEDSDIEISYSREDLDTVGDPCGFQPIQSSSEELRPEPVHGWRSQGQYSVESDPNGYELDLGAISPPSDIEEQSLASLAAEATAEGLGQVGQGLNPDLPQATPEQALSKPDSASDKVPSVAQDVSSSPGEGWLSDTAEEPRGNTGDAQKVYVQPDVAQSKEPSFDLNYEAALQSSFDPYGFKLSPEHSSHTLLDPDEAELSPDLSDNDLAFDPEPSSQPDELNFDTYGFDITSSQTVRDSDPYGFKLSPEEENQEVLDLCCYDDQETMDLPTCDNNEQVGLSDYCNQEILEPHVPENQEVLEHCSNNTQKDLGNNGNLEALEPSVLDNNQIIPNENEEILDPLSDGNQEVVEPFDNTNKEELLQHHFSNQEVLEPCSPGNQELLDFSLPENQEVPDLDAHGNQELLDYSSKGDEEVLFSETHDNQEVLQVVSNENQEVLDLGYHDNQEVLDLLSQDVFPEANNNNKCFVEPKLGDSPTNNSSDSDVATEDLLGLELSRTNICTEKPRNTNSDGTSNVSVKQEVDMSRHVLEGDLGSVFGAGGYIGCADVADDLEPLGRRQVKPVAAEPARPLRPVRPPRPSLKAKGKAQFQTQGIDLK